MGILHTCMQKFFYGHNGEEALWLHSYTVKDGLVGYMWAFPSTSTWSAVVQWFYLL